MTSFTSIHPDPDEHRLCRPEVCVVEVGRTPDSCAIKIGYRFSSHVYIHMSGDDRAAFADLLEKSAQDLRKGITAVEVTP